MVVSNFLRHNKQQVSHFDNLINKSCLLENLEFAVIIRYLFLESFIEILQVARKIWRFSLTILTIFISFLDFLPFSCCKWTNKPAGKFWSPGRTLKIPFHNLGDVLIWRPGNVPSRSIREVPRTFSGRPLHFSFGIYLISQIYLKAVQYSRWI